MLDLSNHDLFRYYHGDVAVDCREFCDSFVFAVEGCMFYDIQDIQNCHIGTGSDTVSICHCRMHFAQITHHFTFVADQCLTSRMQESFSGFRIVLCFLVHTDLIEELFYHTLHIKEITVSVHTQCEHHTFIRQFGQWKCFRQIYIAQFIQTHIFISSVIVGCQRSQHTVQRNGSHDTEIFTQRVGNCDCFSQFILCRNLQFVKYLRAFEGIAVSLGESAVLSHISCHFFDPQFKW